MNFARVPVSCAPLALFLTLGAGAQSADAPDAAQRDRLKADVERVAVDRAPGSAGWNQVRTLIEKSVDNERFQVETHAFDESGRNVIATRKGTTSPEQVVVLSAHYDHIRGCKGADDNASGVAVALEAARQLSRRSFLRTLVIAFWDREEEGLIGSRAWAMQAKQNGTDIRVMISLDGVAIARHAPNSQRMPQAVGVLLPDLVKRLAADEGRADFIAALGDSASATALAHFEAAGAAVGQPAYGIELQGMTQVLLADAARSDHASFWLAGYPGIMITDTANFRNPNYHCGNGGDDPDTLDYDFLNKVASVVIRTVEASLQTASAPQ
jgi:Zn-dependent M28 family amino/carboxypeptidase